MTFKTADLCDDHEGKIQIMLPGMRDFGGNATFSGQIVTLKLYEDNSLVREAVSTLGEGKVLVVDGGGSMRCALLGDMLAEKAVKNGWNGILVYGCIRDSLDIGQMDIGVKALNTIPIKSVKRGVGEKDLDVTFMGITFRSGEYLYSDHDGVITAKEALI